MDPPGTTAEIFAPGIVSTALSEWCITITPDLNEIFFTVTGAYSVIVFVKRDSKGEWSKPEVAPFSGKYSDYEPMVAPDGEKIYFVSNRPLDGYGEPKKDTDIWYSERTSEGWSEAHHTGDAINTGFDEYYPAPAANGTLYFTARRDGDSLGYGIYRAEKVGDGYGIPVRLDDSVNAEVITGHSYISPDESYIIYSSNGREDSKGRFDLYISFKINDSTWSKSRDLGDFVNSSFTEDYPFVSPDGKYLFFTSARRLQPSWREEAITYEEIEDAAGKPGTGSRDIYWIDASIIDSLRPSVRLN